MDIDRRKFKRFPVSLKIEIPRENQDSVSGVVTNFSRDGLEALFDELDSSIRSGVDCKIQSPNQEDTHTVNGEIMWREPWEGKLRVGLRFNEIAPAFKADILDYAYRKWLEETIRT